MFSGEKILLPIVAVLLIGGSLYFAAFKLHQEISGPEVSSSPSPSTLDFVFNQSLAPVLGGQPNQSGQSSQPKLSELPLEKIKRLDKFPGILKPEELQKKVAVIQTNKGVVAFEVYPEATQAASNFLILASNGFYDGLTFHRVEKDFVVQGGDPLGNGNGGPGYTFADEPVTRDYTKGTVAYANAGPNTNGSQFFIMLSDHPELPKKYTIFGKVLSGMDVVEKIAVRDIMQKVTVQNLK